jgi:hypothetical protein
MAGSVALGVLLVAASQSSGQRTSEAAAEIADVASLAPLVTWQGPDSAVAQAGYFRIADEEGWVKLWERHVGEPAKRDNISRPFMPRVNFDRCMVVAIFKGDATNSNGVTVESVSQDDERVLLRIDESTYQTSGPDGGGVKCRPFGIFVLPKSAKPVVIEENVQGLKDQPEKWKERARAIGPDCKRMSP